MKIKSLLYTNKAKYDLFDNSFWKYLAFVVTMEQLRFGIQEDCLIYGHLLASVAVSIRNCLLTTNSSANFWIYAYNSELFRDILKTNLMKFHSKLKMPRSTLSSPLRKNNNRDIAIPEPINEKETHVWIVNIFIFQNNHDTMKLKKR